MTITQTPLSSALKNLHNRFRDFAQALKNAFQEFFKSVASWFDRNIKPLISFMKKYERDVARHKHNQHTRSTWKKQWDSTKFHQVMNKKPSFAVARRNC